MFNQNLIYNCIENYINVIAAEGANNNLCHTNCKYKFNNQYKRLQQ